MKRAHHFVQVAGYLCSFVAAAAVVSAIVVYVISEQVIHRKYDVALDPPIEIPTDAASIAEGERLARIRGCKGGCHGDKIGGRAWDDPIDLHKHELRLVRLHARSKLL